MVVQVNFTNEILYLKYNGGGDYRNIYGENIRSWKPFEIRIPITREQIQKIIKRYDNDEKIHYTTKDNAYTIYTYTDRRSGNHSIAFKSYGDDIIYHIRNVNVFINTLKEFFAR